MRSVLRFSVLLPCFFIVSLPSAWRLSKWISYFLTVVPPRSRRNFLELLCGCLISPEDWVSLVLSSISFRCHWTTFYKLLERESLRTQALAILPQRESRSVGG